MLIGSLDKSLASVDASQLVAHSELVHMNHEAKRINNSLVQLLTLYKLGHNIYPFDPQPIHLDEFLQGIVAQYAQLLKFHEINFDIHVNPQLYGYFDEDLVSGVIANALNNAMRFTHDRIHISATENSGKLELRIEDNGSGYPAQILQEWDNHIRGVNFQDGSTGLGLYFSAMVAGMHHNHEHTGELKLENGGSLNGACFILRLP